MPKDNEVDEKAVAWMNPESRDVINAERKHAWLHYFGSPGEKQAAAYTEPLAYAATVAELRAEVERLNFSLGLEQVRVYERDQKINMLANKADAAERRVGELEADARRYRYLRDNANPDSDEGFAVTTEAMKGWGEWRTVHISGADLDSAIDTATGADPT